MNPTPALIRHRGGALVIALAAACAARPSADAEPGPGSGTSPPASAPAAAPPSSPATGDPFAPQPDESEGLTNVSPDLDAVLEHGALAGACDRYRAGQIDRKTMLTCGKWMFFYETFGTAGVPAALVKFLAQSFPDELGIGFAKLGMIADPASADKLPLGLAPTAPMSGGIDAVAFTCASCHFGRLPDARYAVGAPNHDYDYGRHILTLTLAPTLGLGTAQAADHDAAAVAKVKPVVDRLAGDFALKAKFGLALLPLASMKQPGLTPEVERQYASWVKGTLDFVIAPLPIDDGVHIVGKMIGLWGIPRAAEIASSKMSSSLLAWTGDARSLEEFLRGFATLGGVATPSDEALRPLAEYVYSLRAPANPSPPAAALVARGKGLYESKGCVTCHDGPRGSGKRVYTFDEIGTDRALAKWVDPTMSGSACCGLAIQPGTLTHGVKSPRLVGTWALRRFLHNGSLETLEQLFCLEPRPAGGPEPLRSDGHAFTCDGLAPDEKRALIAYVRAH
jgi:hypothetical protein